MWGSFGPHEQEGFGEERPEQPSSQLTNFRPVYFVGLLTAKPAAWDPSEFPTPPWLGRSAALEPYEKND
ncbi:hypothetical protein D0962_09790 [Leptolyngbyaceae cyanobacterium CCMR0082]|uniref:Uncharacterized protein n=1 Tax=Adonisia turfae CCMR0082 TaxID=2304604 RepID=A0A6M0S3G5_9CYAN|nr:hypothetical protein [Adonisia turfae CCMR0082]